MTGGATFRIIINAFTELGYGIEWQILNSKNYGVPQNRERVFIIGHFRDRSGGKVFPIEGANGQNPCKLQEITSGVADSYRIYNADGIARTLKSEGGGLGAKTGLYAVNVPFTVQKEKGKGSSQNLKIKRIGDETASTVAARYYKGLSADGCNGVITESTGKCRIRRLTPRECWRLQGFPDEYFDRAKASGLSDTQLYKQAGNAVTVNVAECIGKKIMQIYG